MDMVMDMDELFKSQPYAKLIDILKRPAYDSEKDTVDKYIFNTPIHKNVSEFITYIQKNPQASINYFSYMESYNLLENISNIKLNSTINDDFSILQSKDNIMKWLSELNNIYGKEKETVARNIRNKLIISINNELTECLEKQLVKNTDANAKQQQYNFNKKFMEIPTIFNPFIAGFDSTNLDLIINANSDFKDRCVNVKKDYKSKHQTYLTKKLGEFEELKIKGSDDYIGTKRIKDMVSNLSILIRSDIQKLYNIKNVYDAKEQKEIIFKFNEFLKEIENKFKKLSEKEQFLKDKSDNKHIKKKHEFSISIELNTNVLDHQSFRILRI